jgi:flagellin
MADAINAKSASTGITAVSSAGTLKLTSDQGYDISIDSLTVGGSGTMAVTGADDATATAATLDVTTADSVRVGGKLSFQSSAAYTVSTNDAGNTLFDNSVSKTHSSALSSVASINVGSQAGANSAISVVDSALGFINSMRSSLGAVQNRIESTVSNLSATSENLNAARSRIQDADYAQETAALTRSQVLQQAGMAMLAQANALPNQVLSLLR